MMASRTTILEENFNLEVPNRLPPMKPPMSGLDATKYCRYHRGIGHNTEYYWALKDKIEELLQAGYVAQFVKKSENHQAGERPGEHQEEQHRNYEADRKRDKAKNQGRQRLQQQRHERQPP
ncbi:hypothetical protein JHK87_049859 [Glycine soja]|nr:hypothetical protein JHK87_049859 [Glycine soja]